ncbi:MAG: PEP/pyruvate-binding domain-containing protein [Methanosphaera sp.]|uniref:PEP/pyruvate-binding domain-containing protein n=1 Tax=Methanosphaera sp. TaxID=2666342 RepID=UPI002E76B092|nr:PEP/pyruvate-binding domain-containing protein [Methanosphaera sp.]MEE1117323.1 PEP/pyruvate-binding domain-containing protein [Methanosphaera sp.]MEE3324243.1 PEP/pyruvate-binding domain-containing protein [Methanosphaera sp.]MEE3418602.1 PEP/pyruvate-binding domain-containing protein [Methanosphaera sp.]
MVAFERIKCGIEQLDETLDNIRLGDNVVWQVSNLKEFSYFAEPFIKQALEDKRNLVYINFGLHEPLIPLTDEDLNELEEERNNQETEFSMIERNGIKIYKVDPMEQFESFTLEVHNIITKEGFDAFYVFDCLSDLQSIWSTDLMMGNFFRVTCPYLFILDTVAYFPVLRGKHSFEAIAKIRETTQLFLDIYSKDEDVYVHPLKVWNRYSKEMFLGHKFNPKTNNVTALTDGMEVSNFYKVINSSNRNEQNTDSWERFFTATKLLHDTGIDVSDKCDLMCNMMMAKDKKVSEKIKEYFEYEDYIAIYDRLVGSGMIGGKACGMLLARKIIEKDRPDIFEKFEPDDSYYIGSDLFYTYIVSNDLWNIRVRQRTKEGYYEAGKELEEGLKNGTFSDDIKDEFRRILDYYGQSPIIVRSSSLLEDGFGNAFAGKYESVFCVNQGNIEDRLEAFEEAVKTVYASMMNISALEYRVLNDLDDKDEQMGLLVQRVSGSYYGDYFFPTMAGVGFSYSPYLPTSKIEQNRGMLRLVMGLGTKAVDRTQNDYPRIVNLNRPKAIDHPDVAERHRYSQHSLDILDIKNISIHEIPVDEGLKVLPRYGRKNVVEHDIDAEQRLRERGQNREVVFVNCNGIVHNDTFIEMMKELLNTLETAYDYHVDIEYTVNIGPDNTFVVNLLQCRPLQISTTKKVIEIPTDVGETYFHITNSSMGRSRKEDIETLVYVDPHDYYEYPYAKKSSIARIIGQINEYCKEGNKNSMLIVPGRIGTSSPELGIPVSFAEISQFLAILEESYSQVGYMPELSFGSHMFQDLVEADIYYGAIFENEQRLVFDKDLIKGFPNKLYDINSQLDEELYDMIHVIEFNDQKLEFYHDMKKDESKCILIK